MESFTCDVEARADRGIGNRGRDGWWREKAARAWMDEMFGGFAVNR